MCCPVISQVVPSPPSGKGRGDGRWSVGKCRSCGTVDGLVDEVWDRGRELRVWGELVFWELVCGEVWMMRGLVSWSRSPNVDRWYVKTLNAGGGFFPHFYFLILKCLKCIDGDCTVIARPFRYRKRVVDKSIKVLLCLYRLVLCSPMVTICTAISTFDNSTFCPRSVFMCFVWISEQTAIISLYNINWLVFITKI